MFWNKCDTPVDAITAHKNSKQNDAEYIERQKTEKSLTKCCKRHCRRVNRAIYKAQKKGVYATVVKNIPIAIVTEYSLKELFEHLADLGYDVCCDYYGCVFINWTNASESYKGSVALSFPCKEAKKIYQAV